MAAAKSGKPASGAETAGATDGPAAISDTESNEGFMRDIQESGDGTNRRGALSTPGRLKSVPAGLFLSRSGTPQLG